MRNVLVTGGAGFIGSHLVNRLLQLGNTNVTVIDNLSNNRQYFTTKPFGDEVSFYDVDIRNFHKVLEIVRDEKIDSCVHLAAKISVTESMLSPFETMDVNVNGTLSLLNACAANSVDNFVFASSAAVYGEPRTVPISEEHIISPLSPYGASKVAGETLVSSFAISSKIRNAINFRFFNVYGKGQSAEYAGVITKFIEQVTRGFPPIIFGDGGQTRDFISVDDIVNAIISVVDKDISGVYNLGTGNATSLNALADIIMRFTDSNIGPIHSNSKKGDIRHSCADITLAKKELGFRATTDIISAIRTMTASAMRAVAV